MSETVRIAVRGTNWLGDSVITIPAVRALRALFPGSPITMLVPANLACLWEIEGSADRVVPMQRPAGLRGARALIAALRRDRYDLGILLPNSFSSALLFLLGGVRRRVGYATDGRGLLLTSPVPVPRGERPARPRDRGGRARRDGAGGRTPSGFEGHQVHRYLALVRTLGAVEADPRPSLRLPSPLLEQADALLRERGIAPGRKVVGLNAGASYGEAKCWPQERFASLARLLRDRLGAAVLAVGGAAERQRAEAVCAPLGPDGINVAGETTVAQLAALAARCEVFVSNDTGPMHLAAAVGTPVVAIVGPTDPAATGPLSDRATIVRRDTPCAPCLKRRCPTDHRCMTAVAAEEVFAAVRNLMHLDR
jgi:heptosyltransferase-2